MVLYILCQKIIRVLIQKSLKVSNVAKKGNGFVVLLALDSKFTKKSCLICAIHFKSGFRNDLMSQIW